MSLVRSRSLPGVGLGQCLQDDESSESQAPTCPGRDSGVLLGSEPPSFVSDPLGDLQSGGALCSEQHSGVPEGAHSQRCQVSYSFILRSPSWQSWF